MLGQEHRLQWIPRPTCYFSRSHLRVVFTHAHVRVAAGACGRRATFHCSESGEFQFQRMAATVISAFSMLQGSTNGERMAAIERFNYVCLPSPRPPERPRLRAHRRRPICGTGCRSRRGLLEEEMEVKNLEWIEVLPFFGAIMPSWKLSTFC